MLWPGADQVTTAFMKKDSNNIDLINSNQYEVNILNYTS